MLLLVAATTSPALENILCELSIALELQGTKYQYSISIAIGVWGINNCGTISPISD